MFPEVKAPFSAWLLQSMYNISQKNTRQLFYPSLLAEWRGLSRNGLNLFGKMKILLPAKTYKRYRDGALLNQERKVKAILKKKVFCFWVDNFNKQFRKTYIFGKEFSKPYQKIDYTAFAISEIPNPLNSKLNHILVNGSVLCAFPACSTHPEFTKKMVEAVSSFDDYSQAFLWRQSIARQSQSFNVPLKLEGGIATQEELFKGSKDGLRYFHPVLLGHFNVSSTPGLARCVEKIQKIFLKAKTYCMGKVDIDIFWKLCKVSDTLLPFFGLSTEVIIIMTHLYFSTVGLQSLKQLKLVSRKHLFELGILASLQSCQ